MDPSDAPDPERREGGPCEGERQRQDGPDATNRPGAESRRGVGTTLVPQELDSPNRPPPVDAELLDAPDPTLIRASAGANPEHAGDLVAAEEAGARAGAELPPGLAAPGLEASSEVAGEGLRTTHDPATLAPVRGRPSPVRSFGLLPGVWLGVTLGIVAAGLAFLVVLVVLALVA